MNLVLMVKQHQRLWNQIRCALEERFISQQVTLTLILMTPIIMILRKKILPSSLHFTQFLLPRGQHVILFIGPDWAINLELCDIINMDPRKRVGGASLLRRWLCGWFGKLKGRKK